MPKDILGKEIDSIRQVGVNILTDTEVGKDIEFEEIRGKYDAVYIATGTQHSRKIGIDGENLKGVYHGLDFLKDVNLDRVDKLCGVVAVIGGGNTAIDAARSAMRLGAKEVHIFYRRSISDMPADSREIRDAIEEGVKIHEMMAPIRMIGDGRVSAMKFAKMRFEGFDSSGRKSPKKVEGSEFIFDVDFVIPAVSQYSDLPFVRRDEVEVTKWGTFVTDSDTMMTTMEGVFAGGDVVRGADVVITAIADGKNVARHIDKYLGGKGELNKGEPIEIPLPQDEDELIEHERFEMKYLDPEYRKHNCEEVAQGFHRLNAIAEAMRCLRCDRRQS
jgi:NADH-quinone oxidoreductase subunit F